MIDDFKCIACGVSDKRPARRRIESAVLEAELAASGISTICFSSSAMPLSPVWQHVDRDLIETGNAVGLGPKRNSSCVGECLVRRCKELYAVIDDPEAITLCLESKGVPHPARDFYVLPANLLTAAFDHAIKSDIVFKRVGAHDVIIVGIKDTNSDSPGLIDVPCDRFEAERNFDVFGADLPEDCKRKAIVRPIRAFLFDSAAA